MRRIRPGDEVPQVAVTPWEDIVCVVIMRDWGRVYLGGQVGEHQCRGRGDAVHKLGAE